MEYTDSYINRSSEKTSKQEIRIIVSTEGQVTEPKYFWHLNELQRKIFFEIADFNNSAPKQVFQALKDHVKSQDLDSKEYWVVIDRDDHPLKQYNEIHRWCLENPKYKMAVSNPCFELWLIFHHSMDEEKLISDLESFKENQKLCQEYYKNEFGYQKNNPNFEKFTLDDVKLAIYRASKFDTSDESGWPVEQGCTTVYRIVENYF